MSVPDISKRFSPPTSWDIVTPVSQRHVEVGEKSFVPNLPDYKSCTSGLTTAGTFNDICKSAFGTDWEYDGVFQDAGVGELVDYTDGCIGGAGYPVCKLVTASAPIATFCTTGVSGSTIAAADPSVVNGDRFTSPKCLSAWQSKCTANNIGRDSECIKYADKNPNDTYVQRTMGQYCVGKMDDPRCVSWCMDPDNLCDAAMVDHCKNEPSGPGICSCINSDFADAANPRCVDNTCVDGGYLTSNMRAQCPNIVDCSVINNIRVGGDISDTTNEVKQQCGSNVVNNAPTDNDSNDMVIIFIFIFILLIVAIATSVGGFVAYKKFPEKFHKMMFWK